MVEHEDEESDDQGYGKGRCDHQGVKPCHSASSRSFRNALPAATNRAAASIDPSRVNPNSPELRLAFSRSKIAVATGVTIPIATLAVDAPLHHNAASLRFSFRRVASRFIR